MPDVAQPQVVATEGAPCQDHAHRRGAGAHRNGGGDAVLVVPDVNMIAAVSSSAGSSSAVGGNGRGDVTCV
jgi:hypothetical protein